MQGVADGPGARSVNPFISIEVLQMYERLKEARNKLLEELNRSSSIRGSCLLADVSG